MQQLSTVVAVAVVDGCTRDRLLAAGFSEGVTDQSITGGELRATGQFIDQADPITETIRQPCVPDQSASSAM